ncbi:cell wall hydrolase [Dethiothermospora halolimnae]|uniref:cell wall hydrolase n=1 Tax=Dethiothermospora halolimnae TaxID=3114390 RepID=UPI003CCB76C7
MYKKRKIIISLFLILLLVTFNISGAFADHSSGNSSYRLLRFGSRGSDVSSLQSTLNNKGYWAGPVDGIYGPLTEKAVINFQKSNNLLIDGIAGPETQSTLYSANVSKASLNTSNNYSKDLYWLSRIVHSEAGGESYTGKVAVGNVVLNRVKSSSFPNSIKEVIFEYYKGIPQFSPVADGTIYNNPSQESINAAKDALKGWRPVGNSTYFFNPDKASAEWIVKNKTYVKRIDDHVFYR